jgi:hypothetical protein
MGRKARLIPLKELIGVEQIDIVGIQETIKNTFSGPELEGLAPGKGFS